MFQCHAPVELEGSASKVFPNAVLLYINTKLRCCSQGCGGWMG